VLPAAGSIEGGSDKHPNACNVINLLEFSGTGGAGSAALRLNAVIGLVLDGGTCCTLGEPGCMEAGQGPDGKPCTADDTASTFGAVLPLVTGAAVGELRHANDTSKCIAEGSGRPCNVDTDCQTADIKDEKCADVSDPGKVVACAGAADCHCRVTCGATFCSTVLGGQIFQCSAFANNPSAFVSGSCLAGVFAKTDVPLVGDLVATMEFCGQ